LDDHHQQHERNDDLVDFLEEHWDTEDKEILKKTSRIFKDVMEDMDRLRKEIEAFKPTELSTS
jgi:hypothetical protein